jgi:hypothetical protein
MKFSAISIVDRLRIEISCINLIIAFYLFRTIIPSLKIPFLLLYVSFIIYFLVSYRKRIYSSFLDFLKRFWLVLVLSILLLGSFLLSNKIYLTVFKDLINTFILISVFFILTVVAPDKHKSQLYFSNFVNVIIISAVFLSLWGLLDVLDVIPLNSEITSIISKMDITKVVDYSVIDYNFALLPAFFGIVSLLYYLHQPASRAIIVFYNILLFVFSLNIILSGSRRGIIIFIVIFSILFFLKLFSSFVKDGFFKQLSSKSGYFLVMSFSLFLLVFVFLFGAPLKLKNKTLELLGSKNPSVAQYNITRNIYRYIAAVNKKDTFSELLWTTCFDPKDPNSGWGYRIHSTMYPLTGKNVEIVPSGAKGYLLDKTSNSTYYSDNKICESYTMLVALNVLKGDHCKASVYCFVSDDFDGNTVSLGNAYSSVDQGIVSGKPFAYYNPKAKGVWQKLEIEFDCNDGYIPLLISFTQNGATDLSKLKGYVVFACPEFSKISRTVKSSITNLNSSLNCQKIEYNELSTFPVSSLNALKELQQDPDLIRNFVSKLVAEDTTYYPYKNKIILNKISSPFLGDRLLRWEFALKIYRYEYTWPKKIFGGGFDFLNWYGFYFFKDKTRSDYPHNPFLHILLYSGILGLITFIIFIYKVFYYYIKYIQEYRLLFIFFLLTFFFAFISSGSPFDPPIMGFFVILPFYIHSVHKKLSADSNTLSEYSQFNQHNNKL